MAWTVIRGLYFISKASETVLYSHSFTFTIWAFMFNPIFTQHILRA